MNTFLFNFKSQFAPLVEAGVKTQTIRQTRKDGRRPVPGDVVKLYTGLRTRGARLLRTALVVRCRSVRMWYDEECIHEVGIIVDGHQLDQAEATALAQADGFTCLNAMLNWFDKTYPGGTFDGFITEWEPKP